MKKSLVTLSLDAIDENGNKHTLPDITLPTFCRIKRLIVNYGKEGVGGPAYYFDYAGSDEDNLICCE